MLSYAKIIPKTMGYYLWRRIGHPKIGPLSVTISVTHMCNSKCSTCFIWKLYRNHPKLREKEFKVEEFGRVFEHLGPVFYIMVSGGEPFLRDDLPEICELAYEWCHPKIISTSTNALIPKRIEQKMKDILERCPDSTIIMKPSLDGVGKIHDQIRGVPGNFARFLETYHRLQKLKEEFPNFHLCLGSVISKANIHYFQEIYDFAKSLKPDGYITEIAERRSELFTLDKDITPPIETYEKVIKTLSKNLKNDYVKQGNRVLDIRHAIRLVYYDLAVKSLREKRQVIPCYAGFASCQINPYGDVWPCCVLAYNKPMGNLRDVHYDFRKIWFSKKADNVRKFITSGGCFCPLANASYTNILGNPVMLMKVLGKIIM